MYVLLKKEEDFIKKREYTEEQVKEILKRPYQSSVVLSQKLNIPASTIRRFRTQQGIYTKGKLSGISKDSFIAKYEELKSQQKMAEYYQVDRHTIRDFCIKINFDDSIYKKKKLTKQQIEYIIENYRSMSTKEIAEKIGVSKSAVGGVAHRYNLKSIKRRTYNLLNENYFHVIDSQDKAYFLGFVGADGCLYNRGRGWQGVLSIIIQKEDIKILEILKSKLLTDKPINSYNKYVSLQISSDIIFDDIGDKGLLPRKTYGNTIATVPTIFMPALIRGYFDGDGNISFHKNILETRVSITGYERNMLKLQQYLESQNIFTSFVKDNSKYSNMETGSFGALYTLNKTSTYCLLKLLYKDTEGIYLDRKFDRAQLFLSAIEKSEQARDKQIINYYKYAVQDLC